MARVSVFNNVSIDGYFTDAHGEMDWAHRHDSEWQKFSAGNAKGTDGIFVFGRVTYDQMAGWWPSAQAREAMPEIARAMNATEKIVFSKTMTAADWENTTLVRSSPVAEIRKRKKGKKDLLILGSGTIVALLAQAGLIDAYTIVVVPIVLGAGRTMFEGVPPQHLQLTAIRKFKNGNVVNTYTR